MGTAKTEVMEADIGNSIYRFWYNTVGDFGNEARRLITTSSSFNKDITDKHNETEQKENDALERTKERILHNKIFPMQWLSLESY